LERAYIVIIDTVQSKQRGLECNPSQEELLQNDHAHSENILESMYIVKFQYAGGEKTRV
jgi:hypothetical protein